MIIDYCERTSDGFFGEPLNAISNLAFILAALWGLREAIKAQRVGWLEYAPIFAAFLLGIGSFLFHTMPSRLTQLADVVPIWTLVAAVGALIAMRRRGAKRSTASGIGLLVVGAIILLIFVFSRSSSHDGINGSTQYIPALASLAVYTIYLMRKRLGGSVWAALSTIVFLISIVFRSIDLSICQIVPTGTHFLWHSLNGLALALMMTALYRSAAKEASLTRD